jgi:hypothetical protein
MNLTEEIIERWTKAGLLTQFDSPTMEKFAEPLQSLSQYLIDRSYARDGEFPSDYYTTLVTEATLVAAMMLLTNQAVKVPLNNEWLFEDFMKFLQTKHPKIDIEYTPFEYGWFQVERRICEEYVRQFKLK